MLKKILIGMLVLYLILSFLIPFGDTVDASGRGIVLLSYAMLVISSLIIYFMNGDGLFVKRPAFQNPVWRKKIYKNFVYTSIILSIIGGVLSLFLYRTKSLSYMYDFVTLLVILLIVWNVLMLTSAKIEQDNDPKLRSTPLRNRKKKK